MQVKVRDKVYSGEEEAVMVILSPQDIENIKNMHPEANRYCVFPTEKYGEEEIKEWMTADVEEEEND